MRLKDGEDDREFYVCDRVVPLPEPLRSADLIVLYPPGPPYTVTFELRHRQRDQVLNVNAWPMVGTTPIYLIPHDYWRDAFLLTLDQPIQYTGALCSCGDGRNARPCGHRVQLKELLACTSFPSAKLLRLLALPPQVFCWQLQGNQWYAVEAAQVSFIQFSTTSTNKIRRIAPTYSAE